jgi:hypothetical protein
MTVTQGFMIKSKLSGMLKLSSRYVLCIVGIKHRRTLYSALRFIYKYALTEGNNLWQLLTASFSSMCKLLSRIKIYIGIPWIVFVMF